ncbi:MAG: hypothetical protein L0214_07570 [candidate division NC10 bacterium]|nr:hypothetical protein [candidate division NC10 bacterium]
MAGLDLRPRLVLHTAAGAVVVLVDPTTALSGTATFPGLGAVPYDVVPDFPVAQVVLHVPVYGDVALPIDLTALGGPAGPSEVDLPVLGRTPYEVVLGPPAIPPEQMATAGSAFEALAGGSAGLVAGAVILGLLAWKWGRK